MEEAISKNFIEQIIEEDLKEGKYEKIVTGSRRSQTATCISDMPNQSF